MVRRDTGIVDLRNYLNTDIDLEQCKSHRFDMEACKSLEIIKIGKNFDILSLSLRFTFNRHFLNI